MSSTVKDRYNKKGDINKRILKVGIQALAHGHFMGVALIHMNGRMYDAKLGRFLSPDNYIQEPFNTQNFNRFGYVLNNPLKYTDQSGEFFWLIVAYAAIVGATVGAITYIASAAITGNWNWGSFGMAILGGAITGAIAGAIAPNLILMSAVNTSFGASVAMGVIGGFLPGFDIPIGDFNIRLSPAIAFGKAFAIGANVSVSYSSGNFTMSAGYGVTFYGSAHGTGHKGWEHRTSGSVGYSDGKFRTSLYSTSFKNGETSQRVGGLSLGYKDWNLRYENDGAPFQGILGDNGDRYRTAAMSLSYKGYSIGFNLFTGDPDDDTTPKNYKGIEPVSGHPDRGSDLGGQYAGESASRYRLGAAYIGYRGFRFGRNSEGIRHAIQNKVAHTAISYQPWFKVLNTQSQGYFQYQSYNPYTLW